MSTVMQFDPEQLQAHPEALDAAIATFRNAIFAGHVVSLSVEPKMLTPSEVADRLDVSRPTISRRIAAGEIHSVKVGNRHRVPLEEFERVREALLGKGLLTASATEDAEWREQAMHAIEKGQIMAGHSPTAEDMDLARAAFDGTVTHEEVVARIVSSLRA